ncbi:unnamed protein product [Rotaria sordida]|uniref:PX domain-containing protein n=1 Tax=Rotaria sordida TaxID=392033 RepID=A0A813RGQ3_9BILA|nr:unnamed protein product [Rotaria sordida]
MSNDQEQLEQPPPDFGHDDDDNNTTNTKNDDSMYVSAMSPATVDISLNGEDDDENPFGEPSTTREKTPTNTTNTVESYVDNEKTLFQPDKATLEMDEDDKDLFGSENTSSNEPPIAAAPPSPTVVPERQLSTPPSTPLKQETSLYPNVNTVQPVQSNTKYESQISSSTPTPKSVLSESTTESKPVRKRSQEHTIEITVSDPTKVGEGMSSYMTYRITTKTTLPMFKKPEFSVQRRFSDFLGLHAKLVNKHSHVGIIVPSPPEKDSLSMAKVKISKDESIPTDFIDRRRALLERYLNRLVRHEKLLEDSDVRDFIEMPNELPKSTNTQALSGAGVLRALTTISNQVTKITTKKTEQDQWFEEKHVFVDDLHKHLKHLYNQFNTLFSQPTTEEHPLLSSALIELANLKEKLDQVHNEQAFKEYSILTELIKEYVSLLEMVQLAFHERIKVHQQWLHAEDTLKKKRETKTKLEQSPKSADKLPQAEMEIRDWEGKVVRGKEDFENISTTIKQEMDVFDQTRIDDFKVAIDHYLNELLEQQNKVLQIWEAYLPEANKINIYLIYLWILYKKYSRSSTF